jgi:formylmethanofuran dehydrogenase subunit B
MADVPRAVHDDERVHEAVTCLGCGCACDDLTVVTRGGRLVEARGACALGEAWFADGTSTGVARVRGADAPVAAALDEAARLLAGASRALVYLAPGLSCEAQRAAVALADHLRAGLDTITSDTARGAILAAQERGRAGATLGEVRRRADVIVYWGLDPDVRYPRFAERYGHRAPADALPAGQVRTVIAVDVDEARGPAAATHRVAVPAAAEVAVLTATAALLGGASPPPASGAAGEAWPRAAALAGLIRAGRYVAVVADAEPAAGRDAGRAAALVALSQALNGPTRGALVTLRAGGNRSGADSVLTSQTGYPMAVDFAHGAPRYRPHDGTARACLERGEADAVLVAGDLGQLPPDVATALARAAVIAIGPHASAAAGGPRAVAIDSGMAGVHEAGTALRADDIPLPLRALVDGPRGAADLLRELGDRLAELGEIAGPPGVTAR